MLSPKSKRLDDTKVRQSRRYNTCSAKVAELVDALDLGSSAARRAGSSPAFRTNKIPVQPAFANARTGKVCSQQAARPHH